MLGEVASPHAQDAVSSPSDAVVAGFAGIEPIGDALPPAVRLCDQHMSNGVCRSLLTAHADQTTDLTYPAGPSDPGEPAVVVVAGSLSSNSIIFGSLR
ncbi:MAG: hypothetical protein ACR2PA_21205 [Hyphomicrobiaceae bacterium]